MPRFFLPVWLLLAAAAGALAAPVARAQAPAVRVWLSDSRAVYYVGDRTRVYLRGNTAAYVTVLRIDPSGNLEALFPTSSADDGFVQPDRAFALPAWDGGSVWAMSGAPGLGYLFAVASARPLNLRAIRSLFVRGRGGDRRVVYGDPFATMENVAAAVAPAGGYTLSWTSYQLGGRFEWPRYACYDEYGSWYYGRGAQYESCERVRAALRDDPHYYDDGGRRAALPGAGQGEPGYGYKARGSYLPERARRARAVAAPPTARRPVEAPPPPRPKLTRRAPPAESPPREVPASRRPVRPEGRESPPARARPPLQ